MKVIKWDDQKVFLRTLKGKERVNQAIVKGNRMVGGFRSEPKDK